MSSNVLMQIESIQLNLYGSHKVEKGWWNSPSPFLSYDLAKTLIFVMEKASRWKGISAWKDKSQI